jgi:hypothetical protein
MEAFLTVAGVTGEAQQSIQLKDNTQQPSAILWRVRAKEVYGTRSSLVE